MAAPTTNQSIDEDLRQTREKDWEAFTTFLTLSAGGIIIVLALLALFLL